MIICKESISYNISNSPCNVFVEPFPRVTNTRQDCLNSRCQSRSISGYLTLERIVAFGYHYYSLITLYDNLGLFGRHNMSYEIPLFDNSNQGENVTGLVAGTTFLASICPKTIFLAPALTVYAPSD